MILLIICLLLIKHKSMILNAEQNTTNSSLQQPMSAHIEGSVSVPTVNPPSFYNPRFGFIGALPFFVRYFNTFVYDFDLSKRAKQVIPGEL